MAIEKVNNGFRILGVEGLERTVFTDNIDISPLTARDIEEGLLDCSHKVMNERETFEKICKLLEEKNAVLPSAYEAAICQSKSKKHSGRTPTRTCALYFKEGDKWCLAFDDIADKDFNPLMWDYKDPHKQVIAGRPIDLFIDLYSAHSLNFFISRKNPIIEGVIDRARSSGRVVRLGGSCDYKSYSVHDSGQSPFSRDRTVRAALGAAAEIYTRGSPVYHREEIVKAKENFAWNRAHERALKRNGLWKKMKKAGDVSHFDSWQDFLPSRGRAGDIRRTSCKSIERQLDDAKRLLVDPVVIRPVVIISRYDCGGIDITGRGAGYFSTKGCDSVYGVINPSLFVPAVERDESVESRMNEGWPFTDRVVGKLVYRELYDIPLKKGRVDPMELAHE